MKPTHLDLFSGIGGFTLAAERAGFETIGFSEIEPYACKILKQHWPNITNYGDVRTIPTVRCDLITGGFPCQPHSFAGKRRGSKDDRHLWPAMRDVIGRCNPAWVCGENVPGIIGMELDQVLSDLEGLGYRVQPLVIPACAVDAPHRRDRVWIIANSERNQQQFPCNGKTGRMGREQQPIPWNRDWKSTLRELRGMDDGLSYGVERVDTIRNTIVPQVAEVILSAIRGALT